LRRSSLTASTEAAIQNKSGRGGAVAEVVGI
jgi:hypothetical protein